MYRYCQLMVESKYSTLNIVFRENIQTKSLRQNIFWAPTVFQSAEISVILIDAECWVLHCINRQYWTSASFIEGGCLVLKGSLGWF